MHAEEMDDKEYSPSFSLTTSDKAFAKSPLMDAISKQNFDKFEQLIKTPAGKADLAKAYVVSTQTFFDDVWLPVSYLSKCFNEKKNKDGRNKLAKMLHLAISTRQSFWPQCQDQKNFDLINDLTEFYQTYYQSQLPDYNRNLFRYAISRLTGQDIGQLLINHPEEQIPWSFNTFLIMYIASLFELHYSLKFKQEIKPLWIDISVEDLVILLKKELLINLEMLYISKEIQSSPDRQCYELIAKRCANTILELSDGEEYILPIETQRNIDIFRWRRREENIIWYIDDFKPKIGSIFQQPVQVFGEFSLTNLKQNRVFIDYLTKIIQTSRGSDSEKEYKQLLSNPPGSLKLSIVIDIDKDYAQSSFFVGRTLGSYVLKEPRLIKYFHGKQGQCYYAYWNWSQVWLGIEDSTIQRLSVLYQLDINRHSPDYILQCIRQHYQASSRIVHLFSERENATCPITDIFINLSICKTEKVGAKENKKMHIHNRVDSYENISSMKDMVLSEQELFDLEQIWKQAKPVGGKKQVILLGRPGVGKTTSCQVITYRWSKGNLWPDIKFLFFVRLRDLKNYADSKKAASLVDVVIKFCLPREIKLNHQQHQYLCAIIKQKPILWVLDSYEEIMDIAYGAKQKNPLTDLLELFWQQPRLLVTTRPHGRESLGFKLPQASYLEIMGFTDKNIELFVKRYFGYKSYKKATNMLDLFKKHIVWGLAHVPINLELLCNLWQNYADKNMLELGLTHIYEKISQCIIERDYDRQFPIRSDTILSLSIWYKDAQTVMGKLALKAMQHNSKIIKSDWYDKIIQEQSTEYATQKRIKDQIYSLGLLRFIQTRNDEESCSCYFIHATFQEYYAARQIAFAYCEDENSELYHDILDLTAREKFNPGFQIVWGFVAGILANQSSTQYLNRYLDHLLREPRETVAAAEWDLWLRCIEEAGIPDSKQWPNASELIKGLSQKIYRQIINNVDIFPDENNQLLLATPKLNRHFETVQTLLNKLAENKNINHRAALIRFIGNNIPNQSIVLEKAAEMLLLDLKSEEGKLHWPVAMALEKMIHVSPVVIQEKILISILALLKNNNFCGYESGLWILEKSLTLLPKVASLEDLKSISVVQKEKLGFMAKSAEEWLEKTAVYLQKPQQAKIPTHEVEQDYWWESRSKNQPDQKQNSLAKLISFADAGPEIISSALLPNLSKLDEILSDASQSELKVLIKSLQKIMESQPQFIEPILKQLLLSLKNQNQQVHDSAAVILLKLMMLAREEDRANILSEICTIFTIPDEKLYQAVKQSLKDSERWAYQAELIILRNAGSSWDYKYANWAILSIIPQLSAPELQATAIDDLSSFLKDQNGEYNSGMVQRMMHMLANLAREVSGDIQKKVINVLVEILEYADEMELDTRLDIVKELGETVTQLENASQTKLIPMLAELGLSSERNSGDTFTHYSTIDILKNLIQQPSEACKVVAINTLLDWTINAEEAAVCRYGMVALCTSDLLSGPYKDQILTGIMEKVAEGVFNSNIISELMDLTGDHQQKIINYVITTLSKRLYYISFDEEFMGLCPASLTALESLVTRLSDEQFSQILEILILALQDKDNNKKCWEGSILKNMAQQLPDDKKIQIITKAWKILEKENYNAALSVSWILPSYANYLLNCGNMSSERLAELIIRLKLALNKFKKKDIYQEIIKPFPIGILLKAYFHCGDIGILAQLPLKLVRQCISLFIDGDTVLVTSSHGQEKISCIEVKTFSRDLISAYRQEMDIIFPTLRVSERPGKKIPVPSYVSIFRPTPLQSADLPFPEEDFSGADTLKVIRRNIYRCSILSKEARGQACLLGVPLSYFERIFVRSSYHSFHIKYAETYHRSIKTSLARFVGRRNIIGRHPAQEFKKSKLDGSDNSHLGNIQHPFKALSNYLLEIDTKVDRGDGKLYNILLESKQKKCSYIVEEFFKREPDGIIYPGFYNNYPCVMVFIPYSSEEKIEKRLMMENWNSWVEVISSFFIAIVNFQAVQNGIAIELTRRSGFSFLTPTLAVCGESFRLSVGIIPLEYADILVSGLIILNKVLTNLKNQPGKFNLSLPEDIYLKTPEYREYFNSSHEIKLPKNIISLLEKTVEKGKLRRTAVYNLVRTAYMRSKLSIQTYQQLSSAKSDLTSSLAEIKYTQIFIDVLRWGLGCVKVNKQGNKSTLSVIQEDYRKFEIKLDQKDQQVQDSDFWNVIMDILQAISKKLLIEQDSASVMMQIKEAIDNTTKKIRENESKKNVHDLYYHLELLNELIYAYSIIQPHDSDYADTGSDSEVELDEKIEKIYGKKIIVANGMRAIIAAYKSAVINYGGNGEPKLFRYNMYYESEYALKLLKEYKSKNEIKDDLENLNKNLVSDKILADILMLDSNAVITNGKPGLDPFNIVKYTPQIRVLIVDVTSSTLNGYRQWLNVFRENKKLNILYLVSSGIKNEQIGADKNPFGTIRIFTRDKKLLDKVMEHVIQHESFIDVNVSHRYRRLIKRMGGVPRNKHILETILSRSPKNKRKSIRPTPSRIKKTKTLESSPICYNSIFSASSSATIPDTKMLTPQPSSRELMESKGENKILSLSRIKDEFKQKLAGLCRDNNYQFKIKRPVENKLLIQIIVDPEVWADSRKMKNLLVPTVELLKKMARDANITSQQLEMNPDWDKGCLTITAVSTALDQIAHILEEVGSSYFPSVALAKVALFYNKSTVSRENLSSLVVDNDLDERPELTCAMQ